MQTFELSLKQETPYLRHPTSVIVELERYCAGADASASLPRLLTLMTSRSSPMDVERSAGREKFTSFNSLKELERYCEGAGASDSLPRLLTLMTSRSSPMDVERSAGREKFTSFVLIT
ncbi:hypothetical protein JYU34_001823 [Plutella xylostella]|uniref:Uncharacterized protein n=1 Tax=Plutella xylostella TaxID=51655 RepID=A0ABQ7R4V7_PLUXY|nr:hypothetical protein JYU34_001823 [Plutella xylostella]